MTHKIKNYNSYKGVPIFRDLDIVDGEQVYIGNGQGCGTFWFSSVPEAKGFIDRYRDKMVVTDLGSVTGLIPSEICEGCKGHYSYSSKEWQKATENNCRDHKLFLKRF